MKTVLSRIGVCALLILVAGTVVVAKDWRGITLLKSTLEDVERLLGRPKRSLEGVAYYTLPKEIVVVRFETGLEEERLLIVDGGFGAEALTRLSIYPIGGPGSFIYLFPEKDR